MPVKRISEDAKKALFNYFNEYNFPINTPLPHHNSPSHTELDLMISRFGFNQTQMVYLNFIIRIKLKILLQYFGWLEPGWQKRIRTLLLQKKIFLKALIKKAKPTKVSDNRYK